MNHLLTLIAVLLICASPVQAQTIKTLGYNTTNGTVVANTGTNVLTFTNNLRFSGGDLQFNNTQIVGNGLYIDFDDGAIGGGPITLGTNSSIIFQGAAAATTRANLGFSTNLNAVWTATNASNARSAVGLGATWLTNTNVTNFRNAVELGATNNVEFNELRLGGSGQMHIRGSAGNISFYNGVEFQNVLLIPADTDPVEINSQWNNASVRSNLGLPLPALTNTSNASMMRALTGSTNTNHPYSGSISVVGTNNTNTLVFSNGILQSVQ